MKQQQVLLTGSFRHVDQLWSAVDATNAVCAGVWTLS